MKTKNEKVTNLTKKEAGKPEPNTKRGVTVISDEIETLKVISEFNEETGKGKIYLYNGYCATNIIDYSEFTDSDFQERFVSDTVSRLVDYATEILCHLELERI